MNSLLRLRVREIHGLRRFLYPLTAVAPIPADVDFSNLVLRTTTGVDVPYAVTRLGEATRIDFSVSLAPLEMQEMALVSGKPAPIPDPIKVVRRGSRDGFRAVQQRVAFEIDDDAGISQVVYDGVKHLSHPLQVMRNGIPFQREASGTTRTDSQFAPSLQTEGRYPDGVRGGLSTSLTACKSWATVRLTCHSLRPGDTITFELPLAVAAPNLLCDFGSGGGIYTKLAREETSEVVLSADEHSNWILRNGARTDYRGSVPDLGERHSQAWFHVVDSGKSIAVALTEVPRNTVERSITVRATGDIVIMFRAGWETNEPTTYGVCYHFLNDLPAVAAATCPQSILLPPVVEALD